MKTQTKKRIVKALSGTQTGAVVACALGVKIPNPCFTSKAIVTSDGFIQANFVDGGGVSRHSAFVGSFNNLSRNMNRVADFLDLSEADEAELKKAVLEDWIAVDYR